MQELRSDVQVQHLCTYHPHAPLQKPQFYIMYLYLHMKMFAELSLCKTNNFNVIPKLFNTIQEVQTIRVTIYKDIPHSEYNQQIQID